MRTPLRRRLPFFLLAAAAAAAACTACAPGTAGRSMVDLAMTSAYRPAPAGTGFGGTGAAAGEAPRYQLFAGDLHCHVTPPDATFEVNRGVAETVRLARDEGLDFVVLTPHVGARFFVDPEYRREVVEERKALSAALAAEDTRRTTFVIGMEYTDHRWGHVGAAFADLERVFADVSAEDAALHPERFFERFVAGGGVLVVNHPFVTPLDSVISIARADLSWRPFTAKGPFPAEIEAVNRLAQGLEAYNLTATHIRDRYLLGDEERSLTTTLGRVDQEIMAQQRRMIPVGGSDSHSHHLRATTFLLSRGRAEGDLREALLAGRACVRSPEACSLEARSPGGRWVGVGGALAGAEAEIRARGDDIEILVDGRRAAVPSSEAVVRVPLDGKACSVIRARVGEGYSAPIYANCAFAPPSG